MFGKQFRPKTSSVVVTSLVVALAAGLTACTGSSSGGSGDASSGSAPVEITFQSWVPNIDKAVDAFNASHDDVKVSLETVTAGPDGGYARMLSAVQAGNPADVAQLGYDAIPDFLVNNASFCQKAETFLVSSPSISTVQASLSGVNQLAPPCWERPISQGAWLNANAVLYLSGPEARIFFAAS